MKIVTREPRPAHSDAPAESPAPSAPRRDPRRWLAACGPPALYLVVAALYLTPLLGRPGSAVIAATTNDVWSHLWWLWWVREAVTHGHNPYLTDRLYYPYGVPLYLMGMDAVTGLLSVPLQGLLGLVATFNLLVLLASAFGAYGMYLLALDVTGSRGGALVAGAVFGFAPLQSYFVNAGQLELVSVGFLPLAVLFLLRLRRDGRPRSIALGALCLALATLSSPYQALFLAVFALLFALYESAALAVRRDWRTLRAFLARLAAWGALYLALMSPLLAPAIREVRAAQLGTTPRATIAFSSVNVADLLRPNPLHPLWGAARSPRAYALGYVATALALLGLWRLRGRALFWVLAFVAFLLLSLGPFLLLPGGRRVDLPLLPYNALHALPLASIARFPQRFVMMLDLVEALLAAWGVAWLGARLAGRWPARATPVRRLAASLALLLVLAEFWPAPRTLAATAPDPFYATLAGGPPGAVYELPYIAIPLSMYRQTFHGRPLVGGYISRGVAYPLLGGVPIVRHLQEWDNAGLRELAAPGIVDQPSPLTRSLDLLDAYGIRYVVMQKDFLNPEDTAALTTALRTALPDDAIVWDDARVRAYRVPPRDAAGVVADCVAGWYPVDRREDSGQRFRWTNGDALLSLSLLDREPRTVHLSGVMFSYRRATTVDVIFNGRPLTTLTVGPASQAVAFDLPLAHGYNALQFRSREAPLKPSQEEGLADNRALSVALADVQISGP